MPCRCQRGIDHRPLGSIYPCHPPPSFPAVAETLLHIFFLPDLFSVFLDALFSVALPYCSHWNIGRRALSPSRYFLCCYLHLLPTVLESCCLHFFCHLSSSRGFGLFFLTWPCNVHCNACLPILPLVLGIRPSQFMFFLFCGPACRPD